MVRFDFKFLNLFILFSALSALLTSTPSIADKKTREVLNKVVINEIAWMGSEKSYRNEWIELYNSSPRSLSLEGWKIIALDGSPQIQLKGKILSKGFFLLERKSEQTIPEIKADVVYKGSLSNKGEHLKLIDDKNKLVDEVDCSSGWFAGDNKTKQTMERKNPFLSGNKKENWQTSKNPKGTPKAENSAGRKISFNENIKTQQEKTEQILLQQEKILPAKIKKAYPKNLNPVTVFLISLAISLFSGLVFFVIKRKLDLISK